MRLYLFSALLLPGFVCAPVAVADETISKGEVYWYVSAGDFKAMETAGRLDGEGSSFAVNAGVGVREWQFIDLELEVAVYSSEYNTPPGTPPFIGSLDARTRVVSVGAASNAKLVFDVPRGVMYAGVGLGVYRSELGVIGTNVGFSGDPADSDIGLGYHLVAGAQVALDSQYRVGLEYRQFRLKADFRELSGGRVDVGGNYIGLTFRQAFRVKKR